MQGKLMEWAWNRRNATLFSVQLFGSPPLLHLLASTYIVEHVPALYRKRKSKREERGRTSLFKVRLAGGPKKDDRKKELASSVIIFTLGMDADCRFPTVCSTGTS